LGLIEALLYEDLLALQSTVLKFIDRRDYVLAYDYLLSGLRGKKGAKIVTVMIVGDGGYFVLNVDHLFCFAYYKN